MSEVTFRDFAGAVMRNDEAAAADVLSTLLALDPARARAATLHFRNRMAEEGPAFMGQAMGLRAAVTGGKEDEIRALLAACFGLDGADLDGAVVALRARYP